MVLTGMVEYADEDVIEAPRAILWKLLADHLDDSKLPTIHPLVRSQTTVERSENEAVVDRVIEVLRKPKKSRWRITMRPPDLYRWEILDSDGPWTTGDHLEITYSEVPQGTRAVARGSLTVQKLPFFLSQARTIRRALEDIRTEDVWFLRRYRY